MIHEGVKHITNEMILSEFAQIFNQIIAQLGGRDAVQALLNIGPNTLSNYIKTGHLPPEKHARLQQALAVAGWQFDPITLQLTLIEAPPQQCVLLIVTGGIAAYKALELARRLIDKDYRVIGVMTESAQEFITPLSLSALTGERVYSHLFSLTDEAEMGHIRLAREADIVLIAPATANFIAKLAHGFADDLASSLCLATSAPLAIAPAMNPNMWSHPATISNLACLKARQVHFIGPVSGDTACGESGYGRFADNADIVQAVETITSPPSLILSDTLSGALSGRHILITSGPTHEPIDPVRYIANRSSGKQGHAIAEACLARGANVTLVTGPVTLAPPSGARVIEVITAQEMYQACLDTLPADMAICVAAVADWHVVGDKLTKLKKTDKELPRLLLGKNPDILATLSTHKNRPALVIGFAAETEQLITQAAAKRVRKNCDWIVANHITQDGRPPVFGADDNTVSLISASGTEQWPTLSKRDLAQKLISKAESWFHDLQN